MRSERKEQTIIAVALKLLVNKLLDFRLTFINI